MKKIYETDMNGDYSGHVFGKERTVAEIVKRIAWETEAEGIARRLMHESVAMGHALARAAYTELLARKDALPE